MSITVKLYDFTRALDVASDLIRRNHGDDLPLLKHVHLKRVKAGLIVEGTDRYAMVRCLAKTETSAGNLDDVLLAPRVINKMLSMLREGYRDMLVQQRHDLEVKLTMDTKRNQFTAEVLGLPVTVPTWGDPAQYPDLGKVIKSDFGGFHGDEHVTVQPSMLTRILRVERYSNNEPLIISRDPARDASGVLKGLMRYQVGDWCVGALMSIRPLAPIEVEDLTWASEAT